MSLQLQLKVSTWNKLLRTANKYFKELLTCNWLTNSIKVLTAFCTNCHIKIAGQKTEKPCAITADLKRTSIRKGLPILALCWKYWSYIALMQTEDTIHLT